MRREPAHDSIERAMTAREPRRCATDFAALAERLSLPVHLCAMPGGRCFFYATEARGRVVATWWL